MLIKLQNTMVNKKVKKKKNEINQKCVIVTEHLNDK